ncbi:MAG: hypothetical protein SNJ73_00585 [Acetobacteraceae bacterium]
MAAVSLPMALACAAMVGVPPMSGVHASIPPSVLLDLGSAGLALVGTVPGGLPRATFGAILIATAPGVVAADARNAVSPAVALTLANALRMAARPWFTSAEEAVAAIERGEIAPPTQRAPSRLRAGRTFGPCPAQRPAGRRRRGRGATVTAR